VVLLHLKVLPPLRFFIFGFDKLVYRRKIAIYYLTDSVEIGSREASQELVKAHRFLEEWYASNGDETEADKE